MKTIKLSLLSLGAFALSAQAMDSSIAAGLLERVAEQAPQAVAKPGYIQAAKDAVGNAAGKVADKAKAAGAYVADSRAGKAVKNAASAVANSKPVQFVRTQAANAYEATRNLIAKYPTHAKVLGAVAATGIVAGAFYKYVSNANMTDEQKFAAISADLLAYIAKTQKDANANMMRCRAEVVTFLRAAINSGMKARQAHIWLFLQKEQGLALSVFSAQDAAEIKQAAAKALMTAMPNARYAAEREFTAILNKHVAELMDVKDENGNPLIISVDGHKPGTIIEHKDKNGKVVAIECVGC